MKRLKLIFASLALLFCLTPALVPATVYADTDPFKTVCQQGGAGTPACTASGNDPISGKNGILYKVSRILAVVAGIGAVIVIILGGFFYVTSGGDASKATNAKRAIIGAVIGLVVIAISQVFIAFVINAVQ
jgi:hypothetical protein